MNNQEQIKVIEDKIKELQKEVEKLKEKEKEKEKKWIPEVGQYYYVVVQDLEVNTYLRNCSYDEKLIKYNKVFKTEREAQNYANYLKAKKEYSYEFSEEEWNNDSIPKYYIRYFYKTRNTQIDYNFGARDINQIYFKSKEKAEEFIKKYKKQILKYEFGVDE